MAVRIIQGGSRRVRHLWVRMGYLGALIILVVFGLLSSNAAASSTTLTDLAIAGARIFKVVSYGQVASVCLLAPLFMAGALAQEHAGKTYDILLTTPLSNLQIVIGSLFGRLFFILSLIASGLPIFAILLIFGGVPAESVFVSFAVAALAATTVGCAAVALSVMRKGGRKIVFAFVVLVCGYLLTVYFLDTFLLRHVATVPGSGAEGTTWITPLHPLLVLEASFNVAGYHPPAAESLGAMPGVVRFYLSRPFATFAVLNAVVSLVLVGASTVVLRRAGQADRSSSVIGSWFKKWAAGGRSGSARASKQSVWRNPIAWREASTGAKTPMRLLGRSLFLLIGVGGPLAVIWMYHQALLPSLPGPVTGMPLQPHEVLRLAIHILVVLEVAAIVLIATYISAGCVSREREDGTLDLLLTTPITPRMYIWGKLRGLVSFLATLIAVPVLTLALGSGYAAMGQWLDWPGATVPYTLVTSSGNRVSADTPLMLIETPLLMLLIFLPFVAFCVAVGINWSLRSGSVLGGIVSTLGVIGTLSLVMGLCGPNAAENLPVAGPILNALSPMTYTGMLIDPWRRVVNFAENPTAGRISLFIAAAVAGVIFGAVVYFMVSSMVRTFDQTVRKLSGSS